MQPLLRAVPPALSPRPAAALQGAAGANRVRIVYRMEISGPDAESVGPEIGPQISGDFPEVLAALAERAAVTQPG